MGLAIHGVVVTPLGQFASDSGSVMHVIKKSDATFSDFGEAYISTVKKNCVKGWKRHREMICNLVVSSGAVRFTCLLYTSPSPRDKRQSRMPSSA